MSDRVFIVLDTETTGLERSGVPLEEPSTLKVRGSEVCEIGGIILDQEMIPQQFFCYYCDVVAPECDEGAKNVTGLSMQELRKYVRGVFLPEILVSNLPEFFYDSAVFIGYNVEFDMEMIKQTLFNSPITFTWSSNKSSILPRKGRISVDVMEYVRCAGHRRKLKSFEDELEVSRNRFLDKWTDKLSVQTNCPELLSEQWNRGHNSFYDALNTYLLWGDRVWKKKLV